MTKVLFIGAHVDDEITTGATLVKHIEKGDEVRYYAFSYCQNRDLISECTQALSHLGITQVSIDSHERRVFDRQRILDKLISMNAYWHPEVIYCPSSTDLHQDHQVVHQETVRAFRNHTIYGYEFPWNNVTSTLNHHSEITEAQLDKKLEALRFYKSQSERSYFNPAFINGLAVVRGVQFRCQYAEAFELIKSKA